MFHRKTISPLTVTRLGALTEMLLWLPGKAELSMVMGT